MKTEEIINIEDLVDKKQDNSIYFEEINHSITTLNKTIEKHQSFYSDYGLGIFVTKGSFNITLNGVEYLVDAQDACLLFLQPRDITNNLAILADLQGYVLGVHREAINDGIMNMKDKAVFPWSRMIELASHRSPVCNPGAENIALLIDAFEDLKKAYQRVDFKFHNVLTHLKTTELILEILNILVPKIESFMTDPKPKKVDYKESICNEFLLLAMNNHRTHHTLDFYAEKLHISTQYLTHLVKVVHGMTANKIINDMILLDAKAMLKLPTKSIKEIAFELNFADQSSFGKFFKKHTGISASKYRKTE